MRRSLISLFVALAVVAPLAVFGADQTAFDNIAQDYEAIRQSLMKSTTDGVAEHAEAIRDAAQALEKSFSAERAGVPADAAEDVRTVLPDVVRRAGNVAAAGGVDDARSAFADLTKPLVRWQSHVSGTRPMVVYCPMAKKSWLQPDEPVGNPYEPSMPRCGEIVSR